MTIGNGKKKAAPVNEFPADHIKQDKNKFLVRTGKDSASWVELIEPAPYDAMPSEEKTEFDIVLYRGENCLLIKDKKNKAVWIRKKQNVPLTEAEIQKQEALKMAS